jgi:hypothetical protein
MWGYLLSWDDYALQALENRMAEDAAIMDICKQLHCEIVALREQNKATSTRHLLCSDFLLSLRFADAS